MFVALIVTKVARDRQSETSSLRFDNGDALCFDPVGTSDRG